MAGERVITNPFLRRSDDRGGVQGKIKVTLPGHQQSLPGYDSVTGLIECQWNFPYTLTVPTNWVSGEYLVKLTGSSGEQAYIIFVVRDDTRVSDIVVESPTNTDQAFNGWGGKSLFCNSDSRPVSSVTKDPCVSTEIPAVKVSYNRPYQAGWGAGQFFLYEYYLIYWLEGQGYDLTYTTNADVHSATGLFSSTGQPLHKVFISTPHDEFWSYEARQKVTAIRDKGVGLAFLGADTSFWQVRYEPSPVNGAPNRTIVAYKYNWPNDPDAQNPATYYQITAQWRAARFTYPGHPEEALVGAQDNINDEPLDAAMTITNPSCWPLSRAGLSAGYQIPHLLGYEVDSEQGHQPANTISCAHSPYSWNGQTHFSDMTVYQAASGAWVFDSGTMNWVRFLDNASPYNGGVADPLVQDITQTVLDRMIQ